MQNSLKILRLILLLLIVGLVYGFSNFRNQHKAVSSHRVKFLDNNDLYLSEAAVNKLLIQSCCRLEKAYKDAIVLDTIENLLQSHPMVKNAEVFLSLKNELISTIRLKKPIARVEDGKDKFYLDDSGGRMPLSKEHSARVPIISGVISDKALHGVHKILKKVNSDDFLYKNVIGVHIRNEKDYVLNIRMDDFKVRLGDASGLDNKFKNFKAFYAKVLKDGTSNAYKAISLKFDNQVVCTKI